jgi:hypothetical protein
MRKPTEIKQRERERDREREIKRERERDREREREREREKKKTVDKERGTDKKEVFTHAFQTSVKCKYHAVVSRDFSCA